MLCQLLLLPVSMMLVLQRFPPESISPPHPSTSTVLVSAGPTLGRTNSGQRVLAARSFFARRLDADIEHVIIDSLHLVEQHVPGRNAQTAKQATGCREIVQATPAPLKLQEYLANLLRLDQRQRATEFLDDEILTDLEDLHTAHLSKISVRACSLSRCHFISISQQQILLRIMKTRH